VPIRKLTPRHRPRILAHLLQLGPEDRYLRFGYLASDEQLANYVSQLAFERDEVFGIFNRGLRLIAWAHLAFARAAAPLPARTMAEFGVSVLTQARGRRFGARLFEQAILLARNRGIETLLIHALSENVAMLRLARRAGAQVERHGSESEARLKLPPDTLASKVEEMMGTQAAEVDYQIKAQNQRVDAWLGRLHPRHTPASDAGDGKPC
jgi:GNAT superfamily N-acetyltransferase